MKIKFRIPVIRIQLFLCVIIIILLQTSTYAQEINQHVLTAHRNVFQSFLSADSTLFYSSISPDLRFIRSNGQELNRDELWDMATKMHGGMKSTIEITSMKVKGAVAWMTYHYTIEKLKSTEKETVNYVNRLENYSWTESAIFLKRRKKWQLVQAHYSDAPE